MLATEGAAADPSFERDYARAGGAPQVASDTAQRAYDGLGTARRHMGVCRIVMGLHLCTLQDTGGWKGRTGAKSFRRFLQEEGIEPKAAFQYMQVARTFLLEHAIAPERIALVGMRVLVAACQYMPSASDDPGDLDLVDEILHIVTSLPGPEAQETLAERFAINSKAAAARAKPRLSQPVARILESVDTLTHEARAELYIALRVPPAQKPQ